LHDLFAFLKSPNQELFYETNSISFFLRIVFSSFLVLVAIDIITGILIVLPLSYLNVFPKLRDYNFTTITILKTTLLFPVIEELIFRLPLKKSRTNFFVSFFLVVFFISKKWCFSNISIAFGFSLLLLLVLYVAIRGENKIVKKMSHFFLYPFWLTFYFQAILFGFLHLSNYILDYKYFYLFPLIAISYVLKGCLFGYLRVRFANGIYLCIASHILVNSIYCFLLSS
jgi:hypothetical protein